MTTGLLTKRIEKLHAPPDTQRNYIGASSIGSECKRQIWYDFKGEKQSFIPSRMRRIWETGHILESWVIELLERTGLVISKCLPDEIYQSELPYFKGHFDGIIEKPKAILEIKTANDANFKQFVKVGLQKWMPKYYSQVQAYMGFCDIKSAFMVVLNKDTSAIMDEKIGFDERHYRQLVEKARYIYECKQPPPRISENPTWWACKMCKFREVCHK